MNPRAPRPPADPARIAPAAAIVARRLEELAATSTGEAERLVTAEELPAPRAVHEAAGGFARSLGAAPPGVPDLALPSVLVARDLAPADTAGLDPAKVLALVTEQGGPTSRPACARGRAHPRRRGGQATGLPRPGARAQPALGVRVRYLTRTTSPLWRRSR